jgi:hypothetical protein
LGNHILRIFVYSATVDAEDCYAYYIGIIETIYGSDSLKVGQCYYLLGLFYDEHSSLEESSFSEIQS